MAIRAVVFDFDGVLVESVDVKLEAYVALCDDQAPDVRACVRAYCEPRLGLSRFRLIEAFHQDVLHRPLTPDARHTLLAQYSALVLERVVAAPLVHGTKAFMAAHAHRYRCFVVSGTPETELHDILRRRGMSGWFEAAYGSPTPKDTLLTRLLSAHGVSASEAVYVGDTEHDWAAVRSVGMPFIWRQRSPAHARPNGFDGPAIESLEGLASCLAGMTGALERPAV